MLIEKFENEGRCANYSKKMVRESSSTAVPLLKKASAGTNSKYEVLASFFLSYAFWIRDSLYLLFILFGYAFPMCTLSK